MIVHLQNKKSEIIIKCLTSRNQKSELLQLLELLGDLLMSTDEKNP